MRSVCYDGAIRTRTRQDRTGQDRGATAQPRDVTSVQDSSREASDLAVWETQPNSKMTDRKEAGLMVPLPEPEPIEEGNERTSLSENGEAGHRLQHCLRRKVRGQEDCEWWAHWGFENNTCHISIKWLWSEREKEHWNQTEHFIFYRKQANKQTYLQVCGSAFLRWMWPGVSSPPTPVPHPPPAHVAPCVRYSSFPFVWFPLKGSYHSHTSDFCFPLRREVLTTFTNKGIKSALWENYIKNNEAEKENLLFF